MLLKCVESCCKGDDPLPNPLIVGETYEVVELLENLDHVMARKPGETNWPKPGDHWFCLHPELFERTNKPIEIVSCGYWYFDSCDDMFGVVIEEPEYVERLRSLNKLWACLDNEIEAKFELWRKQYAADLPEWLAKVWHEIITDDDFEQPDFWVQDGPIVFPKDMAYPFAPVGFRAGFDRNEEQATRGVEEFLARLKIPHEKPDSLDVECWIGDGSPRLINAPVEDGGLLPAPVTRRSFVPPPVLASRTPEKLALAGTYKIRRLEPQDRAAWLRLRQALWPESKVDTLESEMNDILEDHANQPVFVAAGLDGDAVGFIEVSIHPHALGCETRPVGYVEGWYVDPHLRVLGVGRRLMEAAENWMRERGCTEAASDAHGYNHVSRDAHEAMGYTHPIIY